MTYSQAHTGYVDSGCGWHPSCLQCPEVLCRYDVEKEPSPEVRSRDERIVYAAHFEGLTHESMARRFGLSRRQIIRIVKRADTTWVQNTMTPDEIREWEVIHR